jgi:hypothetical protein
MQDSSTVSGNKAISNDNYDGGGGVYADGSGIFIMKGGAVSGNTSASHGGGVSTGGITFGSGDVLLEGGTISGNTAGKDGGGVNVGGRSGTLTMKGGAISGNTAGRDGGGVNGGTFTMQDGAVSGNTAGRDGGGVWTGSDNFTMQSGTLSGNTAKGVGGGVYVDKNFTKTGGTIYGGDAEKNDKNTATKQQGHAVYSKSGPQWRNVTAGPAMNPDVYGFWLND